VSSTLVIPVGPRWLRVAEGSTFGPALRPSARLLRDSGNEQLREATLQ